MVSIQQARHRACSNVKIRLMIIALILLGLCLGSFINALVWRLHEQAKTSKQKLKKNLSIVTGRSMCPRCGHTLSAADLLPIISWLSLTGKCRYCKRPIHWQYPVVELLTTVLFVISYLVWPYGLSGAGAIQFIFWLPILVVLIALFVYDLRWMILPDRLNLVLFCLSALQIIALAADNGGLKVISGGFLGVLSLAGLFYFLFQVSGGRWIGGGDIKLGVGLGLIAGSAPKALMILFLASFIGTIISLGMIAINKASHKSQVPFGPFLISAAIIVQLYGPKLINWYRTSFLLV